MSFPLLMFGQSKEGKIVYHQKIKLLNIANGNRIGNVDELNNVPEVKWLHFSEKAALYTNAPPNEQLPVEVVMPNGDRRRVSRGMQDMSKYVDYETKQKIELFSFDRNRYLITEKADSTNWLVTGEEKQILGYKCYKAVHEITKKFGDHYIQKLGIREVWFTPDIPISTGPDGEFGLAGAILEMTYKSTNFEENILAVKVEYPRSQRQLIRPAQNGEIVTREQFQQIMKDNLGLSDKDVVPEQIQGKPNIMRIPQGQPIIIKRDH